MVEVDEGKQLEDLTLDELKELEVRKLKYG